MSLIPDVKEMVERFQWDSGDADGEAIELSREIINFVVEQCYLTARGTDKLKFKDNSQMYWKGRADAASDVRALKTEQYLEDGLETQRA